MTSQEKSSREIAEIERMGAGWAFGIFMFGTTYGHMKRFMDEAVLADDAHAADLLDRVAVWARYVATDALKMTPELRAEIPPGRPSAEF
jgi:hypothetical protein